MDTLKRFKIILLISIPFFLIACGLFQSKEQKRTIADFKRYVETNRHKINDSSQRFGIPINYTIVNNDNDLLKWVIRRNADVNVRDQRGETPLHKSIIYDRSKRQKIKSILIKNGANVNSTDNYGTTPLHTAVSFGKVDAADFLISHGADVNARARGGETPLHFAARLPFNAGENRIGAAQLLLRSGADINVRDNFGRTPLFQSAMVGNAEMTEFLLEAGADPNSSTPSGRSPLHMVAANGHSNVASTLIEHGAMINQRTSEGITPLSIALHFPAMHYNSEGSAPVDTKAVVSVLREHGATE
jgi:ankyrin repeat protein